MNTKTTHLLHLLLLLVVSVALADVGAAAPHTWRSTEAETAPFLPADPPKLDRIVVTPNVDTLQLGQSQDFKADGYDQYGNPYSISDPRWEWSGGTLTPPSGSTSITYTPTETGEHFVSCSQGPPGPNAIDGSVMFNVQGSNLDRIVVVPENVDLNLEETQQFEAKCYDILGNEIPCDPIIWSTTGGEITTEGLYSATQEGTHEVTASVSGSTVTGNATVHVAPPDNELDRIVVTPENVDLNTGETQPFTAKGYKSQGAEAPIAFGWIAAEIPITPTWSATGGPITQDGLYTAGSLPGRYQVTAEATVGNSTATGFARVEITGTATGPDLDPDQSWIHTFTTAGVYPYYDRYNPNLRGTVVVSPTRSTLGMLNASTVISITAAGFDPFSVTIGVSDTVRWTNTDIITHAIRGGVPYNYVYLPLVARQ